MVYKVTRYVCEGCGSTHSHEQEAKQCEYRCEEKGKLKRRKNTQQENHNL